MTKQSTQKYVLKHDITVKIKYFNSILIIKKGSKCVPLYPNGRGMIFKVQPFFLEEKDDLWIRQCGHTVYKKHIEQIGSDETT